VGTFSKISRTIGVAIRDRAMRIVSPPVRQRVPMIFRSQFRQAQKRNIRRLTHQVVPIRSQHTKRIRPPIPGLYRSEIARPSTNFGKLLPQYPKFKNFMTYRPKLAARQQPFKASPIWGYNESARTFLLTRPKSPLTTLSRHDGASLVGSKGSITSRDVL